MPGHALARKFDQKQAVPFADVIDLDAPFVDLAPMNDDLFISTARALWKWSPQIPSEQVLSQQSDRSSNWLRG
jgi:hypothetical protein